MSVIIFSGPTLRPGEVARHIDAEVRPPAVQGDIYRAVQSQPAVIGLIDGLFERMPSVWHKETLWAMHRGVRVYGSASMGALRAAELYQFGMIGVGRIFEAYRDFQLEDDDEVAVIHGPAELGHIPLSEPMVNIRATLEAARDAGVLGSEEHEDLLAISKRLHYGQRSFDELFRLAPQNGFRPQKIAELTDWVAGNRIDQKRADAIEMLDRIQRDIDESAEPVEVMFLFEHTETWDCMINDEGVAGLAARPHDAPDDMAVLEELRLGPNADEIFALAFQRAISLHEASRQHLHIDKNKLDGAAQDFWDERKFADEEAFQQWLADNGLSLDQFFTRMEEQSKIDWVRRLLRSEILRQAINIMKIRGEYKSLADRARKKYQFLRDEGLESASPADTGLEPEKLLQWHFQCQPVKTDLNQYITDRFFDDSHHLMQALAREKCFLDDSGETDTPAK